MALSLREVKGSSVKANHIKISDFPGIDIFSSETSSLNVSNTDIKNGNIGVQTSDMSEVTLQNLTIENCKLGFSIPQNRPEFGPSKTIAYSVRMANVKTTYLLDKYSVLSINGKLLKPFKAKD